VSSNPSDGIDPRILNARHGIFDNFTFCIIFDSIFSEYGMVECNKYLEISKNIQISSVMGGTRVAQRFRKWTVLRDGMGSIPSDNITFHIGQRMFHFLYNI